MASPAVRITLSDFEIIRSRTSGLPICRFCLNMEVREEGRVYAMSVDGCLAWWTRSKVSWVSPRVKRQAGVGYVHTVSFSPDMHDLVASTLAVTDTMVELRKMYLEWQSRKRRMTDKEDYRGDRGQGEQVWDGDGAESAPVR